MKTNDRFVALLAALLLAIAMLFPFWKIILEAPQYPEGIVMKIWISGLAGDMEKINGLNHYIGMATIHEENFPEFAVLPWAFGFLIGLALAIAFTKKRWVINAFLIFAALFATALFYRFWAWEYKYGHELDPTAAIKIPGMTYQPPLFGWKKLLNFLAGSLPDIGAYFTVAAVLLVGWLAVKFRTWKRASGLPLALGLVFTLGLSSCSNEVKPITYGSDQCAHCRMSIEDNRFGSAVQNGKGKTFHFDSIECMAAYAAQNSGEATYYATDFDQPGVLASVDALTFLQGGSIQSPMGGQLMALTNSDHIEEWKSQPDVQVRTWQELVSQQ